MTSLFTVCGLVVAVAGAVRSTWSPCGLSMLSTITPLAEGGRGHKFWSTSAWFVAGATAGGATLGAAMAALAAASRAAGAGSATAGAAGATAVGIAVAVLAATCASSDGNLFSWALPIHRRQVNELWLDRFRAWVYGAGFGWQIGSAFSTYIVTAAVYLMIALAVLGAHPATALVIGVVFGLTRGLAVLLSSRVSSTDALLELHRRFHSTTSSIRVAVIALQGLVAAAALCAVLWPPSTTEVTGTVAGAGVVFLVAVVLEIVRPALAITRGLEPEPAR